MGLREWIIVIAAVVMLGIIVDAIRRVLRQRRSHPKPLRGRLRAGQTRGDRSRDRVVFTEPDDAPLFAEPMQSDLEAQSESARTTQARARTQPEPAASFAPKHSAAKPAAPDFSAPEGQRIPMLLDAVQPEPETPEPQQSVDQFALNLPEVTDSPEWPQWDEPLIIDTASAPESAPDHGSAQAAQPAASDADSGWEASAEKSHDPQDSALSDQLLAEPEEVLVMTVLANADEPFDGPSLLQLMLACGLRYGQMQIFHASDAQGALQYSVANAFKPGTFDLEALDQFNTRGVTFFLQLPCQAEPLEALSAMQQSAKLLVDTLGGVLLDDERNVMTAQTLAHYHERVRAFQRVRRS